MPVVEHSALVPYAPAQMYELVNDVAAYPGFLPWCTGAQIHERTSTSLRASLQLQKGPLKHQITTANTMEPEREIQMRLLEGPFRHLNGIWRFEAVGEQGCQVRLYMEYEFSNWLVEKTLGKVFNEITHTLVSAFCGQARARYGAG